MASKEETIGIAFLVQAVIGILGNVCFLSQHLFLYFTGCKTRSTDEIIGHLTVANSLVILSRGIPEVMAAFGLQDFLSDLGCKLVFCAHRVGRGVSMGSTCLLSVFQAITISARSSRWAELKVKAPRYITTSTILCWVLPLLLNLNVLLSLTSKQRIKNITKKVDLGYCSSQGDKKILYSVTVPLISITDLLCLGLMLWSSASMASILLRHKQQVQYIHSTGLLTSSPETRATRSILILLGIFLCFYFLSAIIQMYLTFSQNHSPLLLTVAALTNACYPTLCPFVLLTRGHSLSSVCRGYCGLNTAT
ncbi:vomeronasal type-1 receptor 4-like [Ctenodactylus gundi]